MLAIADFVLHKRGYTMRTDEERALETEAKWLGIAAIVIVAVFILVLVAMSYR